MTRVLGNALEPRFADRRVDPLIVSPESMARRRLRLWTKAGDEVLVDLRRGGRLEHGAVIADDGERIIVIEQEPQEALVVRLADSIDAEDRVAQAFRLGHALGNQHTPIEVEGAEIRAPVQTSRAILENLVGSLALSEARIGFESRRLNIGRRSHDHGADEVAYGADQVLLATLQVADSALPLGRFAHSVGLEALLEDCPSMDVSEIVEAITSLLCESVSCLDAVFLVTAHRLAEQHELQALIELDRELTARKPVEGARIASSSSGRRLAELMPVLEHERTTKGEFCRQVRSGGSDGNLAVVEGVVAAGLGLDRSQSVLVHLYGALSALLSAAVRLGRLSAESAQASLTALRPLLVELGREAQLRPLESVRSSAAEMDLYQLRHRMEGGRMFVT